MDVSKLMFREGLMAHANKQAERRKAARHAAE